jgi:hypothetical protein
MLLITNLMELRVVAGRSRTLAGIWTADANSYIPCRSHAVTLTRPYHNPAVALKGRFQKGIFVAWQGNGMVRLNQTRPHCVNQMWRTQSKPLLERHGRGTVRERHGMCESALRPRSHVPDFDRQGADRTGESTTWSFIKFPVLTGRSNDHERCDHTIVHAQWSAMDRNSIAALFLLYRRHKRRPNRL